MNWQRTTRAELEACSEQTLRNMAIKIVAPELKRTILLTRPSKSQLIETIIAAEEANVEAYKQRIKLQEQQCAAANN